MGKINFKEKLIKYLFRNGLFSEYLSSEFHIGNVDKLESIKLESVKTRPFVYTMNKTEHSESRRTISIPGIGVYINAIKHFKSSGLLNNLLTLIDENKHSLSKIFYKNGNIKTFQGQYDRKDKPSNEDFELEDFIAQTKLKFQEARGSKGVLKLDIANFYGSFYTHNIACIGRSTEWAQMNFLKPLEEQEDYYKKLNSLDKAISALNMNRTHGLLTGLQISFVIAEALMATIDKELENELKNSFKNKIRFIRFTDDYDIFVEDKNNIPKIINIFTTVLEKYGFVLNENKQKYEDFPFYIYEDFSLIIRLASFPKKDFHNIYSNFAKIELEGNQKGSLFFLTTQIESLIDSQNVNQAISFLLSVIQKNAKAIPKATKAIISIFNKHEDKLKVSEIISRLEFILEKFIINKYEWEESYLVYTLLKINKEHSQQRLIQLLKEDRLNDLSAIILINETNNVNLDFLSIEILSNKSWLLLYELYFLGFIEDVSIKNILKNEKEYYNFKTLKLHAIKFYNSVDTKQNKKT